MASLSKTRAEHESRLNEERRKQERAKHLVVLMLQHLAQSGYTSSCEALQAESGVSLSQYEVADNIELLSALQEWEDYYELRFDRRPKLVKKLSKYSAEVRGPSGALPKLGPSRSGAHRRTSVNRPDDANDDAFDDASAPPRHNAIPGLPNPSATSARNNAKSSRQPSIPTNPQSSSPHRHTSQVVAKLRLPHPPYPRQLPHIPPRFRREAIYIEAQIDAQTQGLDVSERRSPCSGKGLRILAAHAASKHVWCKIRVREKLARHRVRVVAARQPRLDR